MIELTQDILDDFSVKLKTNVFLFLDDHYLFYRDIYPRIISFFSGDLISLEKQDIDTLLSLTKRSALISEKIFYNKQSFNKMIEWELVDYFEDIRQKLILIPRLYKFLKSSKTSFNYSSNSEFDYTTSKNESLEKISSELNSNQDYQNDWQDIAIRNDLSELDYDLDGGFDINLSIPLQSSVVKVDSILDSPQGQKILGLDIQDKIEFNDNDLVVLTYNKTFEQSVKILSTVVKNSVPEFIDLGRDSVVGSNVKSFALNSIIRQMVETFSTDDSMVNFKVETAFVDGDNVFLEFTVQNRLDDIISNKIRI